MTEIVVTSNERVVVEMTQSRGWVKEHLDVGDILIRQHGIPIVLIERKTVSDLWSSIVDPKRRYISQRDRLTRVREECGCEIVYIIEGTVVEHKKQIWGCLHSLQQQHKCLIFFTSCVKDTIELVEYLSEKQPSRPRQELPGGVSAMKLKPMDDLTPQLWYEHALSLIPGMSKTKASAILAKYPTIDTLIEELRNGGTQNIAEIRAPERRLGPSLAKKIKECLYA